MIVALGSWRGMGATTTALMLAACLGNDGRECWLLEADPAGGAIAGRMQLAADTIGALERVALPTDRVSPRAALEAVAHRTGGLRIVSAPCDPFRAYACHQPRLPWVASLRELPGDVVVDVGRVRAGTPVWPLLGLADAVLVVTSPEVSAAVATSEWLQAAGRVSPNESGLVAGTTRLVFVDSPGGVGFPRVMLRDQLGEQFGGWLPWEPSTVDLIYRGAAPDDRRVRRSALMSAVQELALEVLLQGATRD